MGDIKTYTLGVIEVQENGLIRNRNGRLIGKLLDDVDFEGEHVRGVSLQFENTPTESREGYVKETKIDSDQQHY